LKTLHCRWPCIPVFLPATELFSNTVVRSSKLDYEVVCTLHYIGRGHTVGEPKTQKLDSITQKTKFLTHHSPIEVEIDTPNRQLCIHTKRK